MRRILLALGMILAAFPVWAQSQGQPGPGPRPSMLPDASNAIGGANGMSNPTAGGTAIVYGDSIVAASDSNNGGICVTVAGVCTSIVPATPCAAGVGVGCQTSNNIGFPWWFSFYTDNRINRTWETNNLGVTGDTVIDMAPSGTLGRFQQLQAAIRAATTSPVFVIWSGGQNDVAANETCSQIVTGLRAGYAQLQKMHVIILRPGIYARTSPNAFTSAQKLVAACVNQADRQYQEEGNAGFYYIDMNGVINDPASTIGAPISGYVRSSDGIHLTQTGASSYGFALAKIVNAIYPNWRYRNIDPNDTFDATNNIAGNLISNGGIQVTSGGNIIGSSGGAGTVPGSFTLGGPGGSSGLTLTSAVSQLSSAAGVLPSGSNYVSLTITGTYTAAVNIGTGNIFQFACNGSCSSKFSAGNVVEACAAVRLGNGGANTNLQALTVTISFQDNSISANFVSGVASDATLFFPATGFQDSGQSPAPFHYLCSPRYTIVTPLSFLSMSVGGILGPGTGATATGQIDVGAMSIRKVIN